MKNKAIEMVETLQVFLQNIKNIEEHPYSKGVDVKAVIQSLDDYFVELKTVITGIEEKGESQGKELLEESDTE